MTPERLAEIEKLELAVQSASERAVTDLDGETVDVVTLLKRLRKAYGVDTDVLARKANLVGNIADQLSLFARQTFKTPEQRAAEKQAAEAAQRAEDDQFLQQYLYDDKLGFDVAGRKARADEIMAARIAENTPPKKKDK